MKLFLFGGAELDQGHGPILKDQIKQTIAGLKPSSILHVPFARLHPTEEAFKEGWFKELMANTGIQILDARIGAEVDQAENSLVFINGGHERKGLINELNTNTKVRNKILNAAYIIAESTGSMVTAQLVRSGQPGEPIVQGLGLLKDAIIEPHYTDRGYQQLLSDELAKTGAKYGVGIDCITALVTDPAKFPNKWEKIGTGNVDVRVAR